MVLAVKIISSIGSVVIDIGQYDVRCSLDQDLYKSDDTGSQISQWQPEEEDATLITTIFPQNPVGKERFNEQKMEAIKTEYFPPMAESKAFEVQNANSRRTPSTPQKTTPNSSGKILELTPLWEQVLRYNRLPQNVEKVKVFAELAMRLSDPEWEVRQHALRVLMDLIPVITDSNHDLDGLMIPVVLTEVTYNLGHAAPAVRKSALEVLSIYVKHSSDPEFVMRSIISQGLESPASNSNLALSVLVSTPTLLQTLQDVLVERNQNISHQSLVQVVTVLSKRLTQNSFQEQAVNAMDKLRQLVGNTRFDHFLESYYPQVKRDFDMLCKVYEVRASSSNLGDSGIDIQQDMSKIKDKAQQEDDGWSDNDISHRHSNVTSSTSTTERSRFELSNEELEKLESNSKLYTRSETDSNADSQDRRQEDNIDEEDYAQTDSDVSKHDNESIIDAGEPEEMHEHEKVPDATENHKDIDGVFGELTVIKPEESLDILDAARVVMETEIKFDSETAITMSILEEKDEEGNGENEHKKTSTDQEDKERRYVNDFVIHVTDDETKRTPRRVRFGGEVVKLRTPDSDVTIEIHEADGKDTPIYKLVETKTDSKPKESGKSPKRTKQNKKSEELSVSGTESILYNRRDTAGKGRPRSSHIPLPIVPALSRPQPPWKKKQPLFTEEEDIFIPNFDGGESLTSGSEGEPPPTRSGFRNIRVAQEADQWQRLGFIDQMQLENLIRKDDWRAKVRALDKLTASLRQPEVARFVSVSSKMAGVSLLLYLLKTLHDDRSQRVVCSSLRTLRALVLALPVADLLHELPSVVPGVCRHLGGGASVSVKLEAVEAMKAIMRVVRPAPVMEILFSDKCFYSKSSRLRENALICLMYSMMTFPSTEFPITILAQKIMTGAVSEPRRRVRQAILEALAVLAQFLPVSLLRLDDKEYPQSELDDVYFFMSALHMRLMRKVLPTVSPDGLILYGLHVAPNNDNYSNQNMDSTSLNTSTSQSTDSLTNQGADVEWVMSGTGVLSSGSAHSRTQLKNAQRAFISPTDQNSSSTQSWDSDGMTIAGVSVNSSKESFSDESKASRDRVNDPRQSHPSYANMRPLYLNIQDNINGNFYHNYQGFPKLHSSHGVTTLSSYSDGFNQTWPVSPGKLSSRKLAILEPLDYQYQNGLFKMYNTIGTPPHVSVNSGNLPPLDWRQQPRWIPDDEYEQQKIQESHRTSKWSRRQEDTNRRRIMPSSAELDRKFSRITFSIADLLK